MQMLLISVQSNGQAAGPVAFGPAGGTIGRSDTSTLVLSDPERSVSRLHARVDWRNGSFVLVNLGINPVLCNATVLTTGAEAVIVPGDSLRIGRFMLTVEPDSAAASTSALMRTQPMPQVGVPQEQAAVPEPETFLDFPFVLDDSEPLFDDMTGQPLPRPGRPATFASNPAHRRTAPPSAEELWLAELLRGMGCAAPQWPAPLSAQQMRQVGALLRHAVGASLRPGSASPSQPDAWFPAFEQVFLRACAAGLGETETTPDPTAPP